MTYEITTTEMFIKKHEETFPSLSKQHLLYVFAFQGYKSAIIEIQVSQRNFSCDTV